MIRQLTTLMLISAILAGYGTAEAQKPARLGDKLSLLQPALDSIQPEAIAGHIKKLASDEFEGRAPGTRGERLTVDYLVHQFRLAGLQPGNPNGTYVQKVPLVGYRTIPAIQVKAGGRSEPLRFVDDFVHDFPALRTTASAVNVGIVFAGYGVVAPEFGWDDYAGIDVRKKLVIVLSGEPSKPDGNDPKKLDPSFFKGDTRTYYSTRESKYDIAAAKGAAGVLVVYDPDKSRTYSIFQTFAKMEGFRLKPKNSKESILISGLVTSQAARRLFKAAGLDFDKLQANAARRGPRAVITDAKATLSLKSTLRSVISHNVVARVEGSDPQLKNEFVVYSSHWDHLGKDTTLKGDQIFNGALDDAAGTAQLVEIARAFARLPRKPKRSILFVATTAEERGFLGAAHYARHPLFPIAKTVANINLDGGNVFGVTSDLIATGYGLSTLDEVLSDAASLQGRKFINAGIDNGGLYFASDQIEFAKAGIPAAFPFSGSDYVGKPKGYGDKKWEAYSANDYHKVSDDVKSDWDYSGAAEDAKWLLIAGYNIAETEKRPEWKSGSEFKRRP